MIPMYMKEGYTGAYSAIQYGIKGDIVYLISRDPDGMVLVVNDNNLKFWIHENKLSNQKIEKDAVIPTKPRSKR